MLEVCLTIDKRSKLEKTFVCSVWAKSSSHQKYYPNDKILLYIPQWPGDGMPQWNIRNKKKKHSKLPVTDLWYFFNCPYRNLINLKKPWRMKSSANCWWNMLKRYLIQKIRRFAPIWCIKFIETTLLGESDQTHAYNTCSSQISSDKHNHMIILEELNCLNGDHSAFQNFLSQTWCWCYLLNAHL